MLIANPIYDTVFKFLMEDKDVAKRLIGAIIGAEILELEQRAQEKTSFSEKFVLTVFRVDFKAVIKTADGSRKKVLIELQKAKQLVDIMRFRKYLGDGYGEEDLVDGISRPLPIISIYFLGFTLSFPNAVVRAGNTFKDVLTDEIVAAAEQETFVKLLTHESYFIQIPRLPALAKHRLSGILSVFNQKRLKPDDKSWMLYFEDEDQITDPDIRAIVKRLATAASTDEMREKVRVEEDFDNAMDNAIRQYELKTELALAEAARLEQVISAEKAAREAADAAREAADVARAAAETRTRELEAQLAELLKKQR